MNPISLDGYTPAKRRIIVHEQFYCVYAVGEGEGRPVKIGFAIDIKNRLANMQSGISEPLQVWYLLWFPGKPCAINVEAKCHEILKTAGKHKIGEWFNVSPEWAKKTINSVAQMLYPQTSIKTHEIMLQTLSMLHPEKQDAWTLDTFRNFEDNPDYRIQSRITSPASLASNQAPIGRLDHHERKSGWGQRKRYEEMRRGIARDNLRRGKQKAG